VDTLLTKVANLCETAMWVAGVLFVVEFVAVFIYAYRSGTADKEEGRVITKCVRRSGLGAGRYWSKSKVLVSRSGYVSEMSLVDGTATKAERLIVHGIKLGFLLFWLAFVFGVLTLLPSEPGVALAMLLVMLCGFSCAVILVRRSRADALRELAEKQARRKTPP
jgi:hypothetical protein